jgi:hypothetical protein
VGQLSLGGPALSGVLPRVTAAVLEVRADVGGFDEEADIVAPASPRRLESGSLPGLGP